MPLNLPCVPHIHDFDFCICTLSLQKGTKIIGWFNLLTSWYSSLNYALDLSQFLKTEFGTSIKESKEFIICELVAQITMATVSHLLLIGVQCDISILMLPSILVQLPVDTFLAVMHTMIYGVSGCSDVICGLLDFTACIAYIGFDTFAWVVQYNCYRQLVDKRHCTCGEAIKVNSHYPENLKYHQEGSQDDNAALSAIYTASALTVIEFQPIYVCD